MKEKILILLIATSFVGCSGIIDNNKSLKEFSAKWKSDVRYKNFDNLSIIVSKLNAIKSGITKDTIISYLGEPSEVENHENLILLHYNLCNDEEIVSFDNYSKKINITDDDKE